MNVIQYLLICCIMMVHNSEGIDIIVQLYSTNGRRTEHERSNNKRFNI